MGRKRRRRRRRLNMEFSPFEYKLCQCLGISSIIDITNSIEDISATKLKRVAKLAQMGKPMQWFLTLLFWSLCTSCTTGNLAFVFFQLFSFIAMILQNPKESLYLLYPVLNSTEYSDPVQWCTIEKQFDTKNIFCKNAACGIFLGPRGPLREHPVALTPPTFGHCPFGWVGGGGV